MMPSARQYVNSRKSDVVIIADYEDLLMIFLMPTSETTQHGSCGRGEIFANGFTHITFYGASVDNPIIERHARMASVQCLQASIAREVLQLSAAKL